MDEENKPEEKTEKPKKSFNVDGFVNGCGKVFSMGEVPDDPVVKVLKRFGSWLKYILFIEVFGGLIAFMPYYSIKLLKEGRTDELADFVVKMADIAHNEEAEAHEDGREAVARPAVQCPMCGGSGVDEIGSENGFTEWWCDECKKNFTLENE